MVPCGALPVDLASRIFLCHAQVAGQDLVDAVLVREQVRTLEEAHRSWPNGGWFGGRGGRGR